MKPNPTMTTNPLSLSTMLVASQEQISARLSSGELESVVILGMSDGAYFELNEVGARIWSLFEQPSSIESVRNTVLLEYEVGVEQCEKDLLDLATELVDRGLAVVLHEEGP